MQKRALCAVLCFCLIVGIGSQAAAAESDVKLIVNDAALETEVAVQVCDQTTYVSYWPIVEALYPDAVAYWEGDHAVVQASGLTMNICPTATYLEVNGRYLWVPDGFRMSGQVILVPVRVLGQALGATVTWDGTANTVRIQSGSGPIASGSQVYQSDVVYWLSRIINAESGNQPLEGKIAVGNVVLNRVASSIFPDTVYEVIFQRNQFTPVSNGSIYNTPNAESVIAAKLCLEGANTAGNSLYFVNPRVSPNSWASRNRPYVATIGAHAFFA